MIALIDYKAGNTASVANALKSLSIDFKITNKKSEIEQANKIIFPGVGEASFAMNLLNELDILNLLQITEKPVLGICLGMQLLFTNSEEGNINCLNIIRGHIKKFKLKNIKIPHMGWNRVEKIKDSKILKNIDDNNYFYFANSFYAPIVNETIAITNHRIDFSAIIEKDNYYGVQFHPEKSGFAGLRLLKNFGDLCQLYLLLIL